MKTPLALSLLLAVGPAAATVKPIPKAAAPSRAAVRPAAAPAAAKAAFRWIQRPGAAKAPAVILPSPSAPEARQPSASMTKLKWVMTPTPIGGWKAMEDKISFLMENSRTPFGRDAAGIKSHFMLHKLGPDGYDFEQSHHVKPEDYGALPQSVRKAAQKSGAQAYVVYRPGVPFYAVQRGKRVQLFTIKGRPVASGTTSAPRLQKPKPPYPEFKTVVIDARNKHNTSGISGHGGIHYAKILAQSLYSAGFKGTVRILVDDAGYEEDPQLNIFGDIKTVSLKAYASLAPVDLWITPATDPAILVQPLDVPKSVGASPDLVEVLLPMVKASDSNLPHYKPDPADRNVDGWVRAAGVKTRMEALEKTFEVRAGQSIHDVLAAKDVEVARHVLFHARASRLKAAIIAAHPAVQTPGNPAVAPKPAVPAVSGARLRVLLAALAVAILAFVAINFGLFAAFKLSALIAAVWFGAEAVVRKLTDTGMGGPPLR